MTSQMQNFTGQKEKKDRKEGLYYGSTSDKEYTIRSTLNT